jgi:hypothetical protein
MEVTGCDEQVGAVAERVKGDPTEDPLPGLLTVIPSVEEVEAAVDEADTVMAMATAQEPPPLPQDLTCRVCAPALALSEAPRVVLSTIVVAALLSSE